VARNNLGMAQEKSGRRSEALTHLRRAVELRPDQASGYFNLGRTALTAGNVDEAVECFRRALNLQPDSPIFRSLLEKALSQLPAKEIATPNGPVE
jgi:Flp pilus assembly protein TadD